jgi:hypothetical protein
MRYPVSEKLEIIRTVEISHLPVRQTLKMLGIPSSTFYDGIVRTIGDEYSSAHICFIADPNLPHSLGSSQADEGDQH